MNRALVTSLASLASLLALAALEGNAQAQNFGVPPPPPAQYSATYTSTAPAPAPAYAPSTTRVGTGSPAADFGNAGNLSIGSDFAFNFGVTAYNSGPTVVDFTLLPAVDYFVIQNLSIGGSVGIGYDHYSVDANNTTSISAHTLDFRIMPRVGYNIPLNQNFSIWPRLGLVYDHLDNGSSQTVTPNGGSSTTTDAPGNTANTFGVNVSIPVLWHPHEHYYLGLTPYLNAQFVGDNAALNDVAIVSTHVAGKATSAGIQFVVGGWL